MDWELGSDAFWWAFGVMVAIGIVALIFGAGRHLLTLMTSDDLDGQRRKEIYKSIAISVAAFITLTLLPVIVFGIAGSFYDETGTDVPLVLLINQAINYTFI